MAKSDLYPQFPLYIPSKGRAQYMITSRALTSMGVRHSIVVEPQEVDAYRESVARMGLLTDVIELDMDYKRRYELCDAHGLAKSTGSGPARNFIWDHSISVGVERHWIMDDNIIDFKRKINKDVVRVRTPSFWRAMEDFVLRYTNVAMAGPAYQMFCAASKRPPFIVNTRIYSCNLIRNDIPFRWRGRYNEDTILSLDLLKAGWCTLQFYAFIQNKMRTQVLKGGNTDELYRDGTRDKSEMLVNVHPDVAKISHKFGRCHHHVNYKVFKTKLIRRLDVDVTTGVNTYGMKLRRVEERV